MERYRGFVIEQDPEGGPWWATAGDGVRTGPFEAQEEARDMVDVELDEPETV